MKFKNNLKALRTDKRVTQKELADALAAAGIGNATKQRIAKIEKGIQRMTAEEIQVYASALKCTPDEILGKQSAPALHENISNFPSPLQRIEPIVPSNRKSPVYGPAAAGSPDRILLTEDYIVEYDDMPPELEGVKGGFRMIVSGSSMEPRHFDGEKVSVHPYRKPSIGQDCVIVEEPNGNALIKRFMGETETEWKFSQYNPPKNISLKKAKVRAIYGVVR